MTNKPMLSVDMRQALADFIEYSVPGPLSDDAMWNADKQALRAILDKPPCFKCGDSGEADSGGAHPWGEGINITCDCTRVEPLALQHMAVAEEGKLRWMTGRKMQDCELYAMPDGSAVRSKLFAEQPAPVATVAKLLQAIHEIEGFPGVTGDQLRELADKLNRD